MIFCSSCFCNLEIKSIIAERGTFGICPVCGAKDVTVLNTEELDRDSMVFGMFDNLVSIYTAFADLPNDYPTEECQTLVESIKSDWDIFADIPDNAILDILKSLSPTVLNDYPIVFETLVGIPEKYDSEYLQGNSILRVANWDIFVETLKHKNRFHTNLIDKELLRKYCLDISKEIPMSRQRFYRGRIAENQNGFLPSEMGAPPPQKASDGRANSAGISRLYLTYDRETTFHEIRASEYDYVTVGTFKQLKTITVVDLQQIHKISPFKVDDCMALAINREHLLKINQEMSRTMRRGDSPLDYLPTQYICDFIMSITDEDGQPVFDGIEYQSAMHSKGSNLVVFDPDCFKCTYSRTYEVKKLSYSKELVARHRS